MRGMKRQASTLLWASGLCALALPGVARADLTWEHRLSVRLGSSEKAKPIASVTLRTQWQGTSEDPNVAARMRLLLRASAKDFDKLPPLPFGLPGGRSPGEEPVYPWADAWANNVLPGGSLSLRALLPEAPLLALAGRQVSQAASAQAAGARAKRKPAEPVEAALVTDLASDRFVAYLSSQRTSLGGPLRPTLKRVRFDPWKKLAPALSQQAPEELTRSQRARLGAEVRSVYRPFLKNELKLYFRALDQTRTINGQQARGYRLAMLVNTGGSGGSSGSPPEWAQVRAEMWLAPEQEGDALIRSFNRQSRDMRKALGGDSASMWLNELYPVLWQMMPQEILQAAETIAPPEGAPNEFFGGTPVLVHLTFTPPPVQRMAIGETRIDLSLVSRSTQAIAPAAFEVPAGYKAEPLEPLLKKYEKSIDDAYTQFDKATPKPAAKPKPAPKAKPAAKPRPKAKPAKAAAAKPRPNEGPPQVVPNA